MKILILGAGKVGLGIAEYLNNQNIEVTIIEKSEEIADKIKNISDLNVITGDATNAAVLKDASTENASHIIAVMSNDEQNIVACKLAGSLFNVKTKIARIRSQAFLQGNVFELFLKENFDIDIIIQPELETSNTVCDIVQINGVFDVINIGNTVVVSLKCLPDTEVLNTTFMHFRGITDLDLFVLTITRNNTTFFPGKTDVLLPGDEVYIATTKQYLNDSLKLFGYPQTKKQNIMIIGGETNIATTLIKTILIRKLDCNITILEESLHQAEEIAEKFPNVTTICGDPLDCDFLKEITSEIDTAIVATKREKTNVLSSLFLKRFELKRILTLSKSHDYNSLLPLSSGCSIINPNAITIETIVQKSRKGKITSVRSLKNQSVDIVETHVTESCTHLGDSIKSLKEKGKIVPVFLIRGGITMLAQSDLALCLEDIIILLIERSSLQTIEKIFSSYSFSKDDLNANQNTDDDDLEKLIEDEFE